jgi:hypothetical protein
VAAGNERAKAEGLTNCRLQEGDASDLNEPTALVTSFRNYGPTMNAFEGATAAGRADSQQDELEALFNDHNTSTDDQTTSIPATFLRVTVAV